MINTLVWGFHHANFSKIILSLKEKNIIDPKVWVGKNKELCTHSINDFHELKVLDFDYEEDDLYFELVKELEDDSEIIFDMMSRTVESINKGYNELKNVYLYYVKYFLTLLKNNKIELLLFIYIPHLSVEYILYKVAKKLGIKTLMLNQSLFPNKFFILDDIDDFGFFNNINNIKNDEKFIIDNSFEKELFYMDKKYFKDISCLKSNLKILKKSLIPFNRQEVNFFEVISKILKCRKFNKESKIFEVENIDFDKKYVYFPLHLQPELTTSPLGGVYSDQVLAIEELSKIIPSDWLIYVKENPKQLEYKRDRFFYQRIKTLKNVVLVSKNINTYKLLKNSQIVSVITGTAGWEAISGGKNVLVFGKPWYRNLDGVFEFNNNINFDKIINYKIDHNSLQNNFNLLMEKTRTGVIELVYSGLVDNFNNDQNIKNIENALEKQIIEGNKNV